MNDHETISHLKRKTLIGAVSYFLRSTFLQIIGFFSAVWVSFYFSPEQFGIYGLVQQIIGILIFVSDIGFAAALVQKKEEPTDLDYSTAFWMQQVLGWCIVGIACLLIFSGVVASKTGPVGNWVLLSLAISFPIISLKTIPSIKLERKLAFARLVQPQIMENIAFHATLIWCAWYGLGAQSYTFAVLARTLSGTACMLWLEPWFASFAFSRDSFRQLFTFGAQFQLNDLLARIKDQLFFLALGAYLPLREFGYMQWAKNWSMYPYTLTVNTVMTITFPTFSRLQADTLLLKKALEKSLFFITLFLFPLLIGMAVFITPTLHVFGQYEKWHPAVMSFILFTLSIAWSGISSPITNALNAIGKITITLKLMTMWTVLTWVLTPICVYYLGFTGVALAALIISMSSYVAVHYLKQLLPSLEVLDAVWRQAVAATAMAVSSLFLVNSASSSVTHLLVSMLLAATIYVVVLIGIGKQKVYAEVISLINR